MDKLTSTNTVDELIDILLDAIMRLKDLLRKPDDVACKCHFVPQYIRPTTTAATRTMQEIYARRQASLERYRQQYALEHGNDNDDDFEGGGEDEIDSGCGVSNKLEKNAHDLREPYDWYYNNTACSQ